MYLKAALNHLHYLQNYRPRISIRHLDDELPKVNAGIVVGGVADGADDGEGRAKLQTDLRHGCAFHLNTLYIR